MYRACLAEEATAKELEYAIDLHQCAPKEMSCFGHVGGVDVILRKSDRVSYFIGHLMDADPDAELREQSGQPVVEVGHRLRGERKRPLVAAARATDQAVA